MIPRTQLVRDNLRKPKTAKELMAATGLSYADAKTTIYQMRERGHNITCDKNQRPRVYKYVSGPELVADKEPSYLLVLSALQEVSEPTSTNHISLKTGMSEDCVRAAIQTLRKKGHEIVFKGGYKILEKKNEVSAPSNINLLSKVFN